MRKLSPDISCPLGGRLSSPFKARRFRIFCRVFLQLYLGQNRSLRGKGWATQLLKEVAVFRVHFSLRRRKIQVSASLVFIFLTALNARAAWIEKESRSETSSARGLIHRYFVLEDSATGERSSIELALFATKSCRLRGDCFVREPIDYATAR